jgi:tRNA-2-methylthio-N6-dimethylallyladenosine synthase
MTYLLRTFGCQMNKYDSERVAGMLDALGAVPTSDEQQAQIIVFLTCCVREAADVRLYGQVASLKNLPHKPLVCVGGCIGQRDGAALREQMPHIDVVFGTHNIAHLPALVLAALQDGTPQVEVVFDDDKTAVLSTQNSPEPLAEPSASVTSLPVHRAHPWHAWQTISAGCDNYCSYCVVPYVRGREHSRPFEEITAEAMEYAAQGVQEITLLGQNVNSYGRDLYGQPRFADVLRAVGASGVPRVRFATSHPKDLSDRTIAAFAETPAVMPALHLPVQSGSDRVLAIMNRHYTAAHYLELVAEVRRACAESGKGAPALSTDVIVGFPGETAGDFQATLDLVRQVGYSQVFTFIYSRREGTPAASMPATATHEDIQRRFDELVAVVQQSAWEQNQLAVDKVEPVLFEGVSKRDASMLAGKTPRNQTVHVPLPEGQTAESWAGRMANVHIDEARTWYLRGRLV